MAKAPKNTTHDVEVVDNATGEVTTETGTAISTAAVNAMVGAEVLGGRFKVAKQVTKQVMQQRDGVPFYVRFVGEIYTGEEVTNSRGGGAKMAPAELAEVINLENEGAGIFLLICNTVLKSELERAYPGGGYVNKNLCIVRGDGGTNSEGQTRRYKKYMIVELEAA